MMERVVGGGKAHQAESAPAEGKAVVEGQQQKTSSGWKEHTWSTFISRAEEETEPELLGSQLLSQFQKDKFVHFFYHVLDLNMDHVISQVWNCVDQMFKI